MEDYKIRQKIEKILNDNITHYEFEGTEIDKPEIINDVMLLIKSIYPEGDKNNNDNEK